LGFAFDAVALLAMLYGITLGQFAYYFKTYRGDSWKVQLMVALLLMCETAKVAMNVQNLWLWAVSQRSSVFAFTGFPITFAVQNVLSYVTMFVVQCFFIRSVKTILARKWYCRPVVYFGILLSVGSMVIGCTSILILHLHTGTML